MIASSISLVGVGRPAAWRLYGKGTERRLAESDAAVAMFVCGTKGNGFRRAADALDVGPVRDVALRLVEKIKAEHIERPYATP